MLRDVHHGKPCPYCHRQMSSRDVRLHPTRDHVIPRCRNGTRKIICCQTCNGVKADMLPEVWEAFMARHPGWWTLSRIELRLIMRTERGLRTVPRHRGIRTVVPARLVYTCPKPEVLDGYREEGHPHQVSAMVEAPAQVETRVLEARAQGRD